MEAGVIVPTAELPLTLRGLGVPQAAGGGSWWWWWWGRWRRRWWWWRWWRWSWWRWWCGGAVLLRAPPAEAQHTSAAAASTSTTTFQTAPSQWGRHQTARATAPLPRSGSHHSPSSHLKPGKASVLSETPRRGGRSLLLLPLPQLAALPVAATAAAAAAVASVPLRPLPCLSLVCWSRWSHARLGRCELAPSCHHRSYACRHWNCCCSSSCGRCFRRGCPLPPPRARSLSCHAAALCFAVDPRAARVAAASLRARGAGGRCAHGCCRSCCCSCCRSQGLPVGHIVATLATDDSPPAVAIESAPSLTTAGAASRRCRPTATAAASRRYCPTATAAASRRCRHCHRRCKPSILPHCHRHCGRRCRRCGRRCRRCHRCCHHRRR